MDDGWDEIVEELSFNTHVDITHEQSKFRTEYTQKSFYSTIFLVTDS